MTNKDKIVDELLEVINQKKAEISKTERATWKTNCSFRKEFGNYEVVTNIQTIQYVAAVLDLAAYLVDKKESISKARTLLELEEAEFEHSGFTFEDWMEDFKTRIAKIQVSKKREELKDLESRLDKLVSKERREEIELNKIKDQLKNM